MNRLFWLASNSPDSVLSEVFLFRIMYLRTVNDTKSEEMVILLFPMIATLLVYTNEQCSSPDHFLCVKYFIFSSMDFLKTKVWANTIPSWFHFSVYRLPQNGITYLLALNILQRPIGACSSIQSVCVSPNCLVTTQFMKHLVQWRMSKDNPSSHEIKNGRNLIFLQSWLITGSI